MKSRRIPQGVALSALATLLTLGTPSARAATNAWGGGGGDANWTTAANWTNGAAPGAGDTVMFLTSNYASGLATTLGSNWTVNALVLNTTNVVAISGSTLTLQSGRLSRGTASRSNQTINSAIALGADGLFSVEGAANYNTNLLINGSIGESGGSRSLTIAGLRILHMMGSNTFTGGILITNAAGVVIGGTNAASDVTVGSGGAAGTLLVGGNYALGNGTLTLNTNAIISGYAASRMVGNAVVANGDFTVGPSTTLNTSGGMGLTFTNALTLNANVTISNALNSSTETLFFAGGIGDGGAGRSLTINANGSNRRFLLTNSTYTGATVVNNGYLLMSGTNATSAVAVNPGATLVFLNDNPFSANTMLTVSNGTLTASNTTRAISSPVTFAGATNFHQGYDMVLNGSVTLATSTVFNVSSLAGNYSLTFAGSISESLPGSSLTIAGTRTLSLLGSNSYSGGTYLRPALTLLIGNNNALGTGPVYSSAGSATINYYATNSPVIANAVQMQGTNNFAANSSRLTFASQVTLVGDTKLLGSHNSIEAAAMVFAGGFNDQGSNYSLTFFGGATRYFIISNASSYSGGTVIDNNGGANNVIVKLAADNGLGTNGALRVDAVSPAGSLQLNNFNQTVGALSGTGTVSLGSGTLVTGDGSDSTFSGFIFGTGGTLVKQGAGTLTLGGSNTYTGGTIVSNGLLRLGAARAMTNFASLTLSGGNLDMGAFSASLGALAGAAGTLTNNASLTVSQSVETVFGGQIAGSGTLLKIGSGTLVLGGLNTWTGTTTVAGGVLRANDGVGLSPSNTLVLAGGALETSADFTRGLGSGASKLQMTNAAGFSARGGAATVSIGGIGTPTALTWGMAGFAPTNLLLNAASADSALLFANSLDFAGGLRTNTVAANTATMTGLVTNGGLVKTGAGTLVLANAGLTNFAFTGGNAGTLQVSGGQVAATSLNVGGVSAGDMASLVVSGAGAVALVTNSTGNFNLGSNSQVQVLNGGRLSVNMGSGNVQLGTVASGSPSLVLVSGTNSVATFFGGFSYIGQNSGVQMVVSNTGQAYFNNLMQLGYGGGPSTLLVADAGSILTNSANLYIGSRTNSATMVISNGGRVFNAGGTIGNQNAGTSRSNLVVVTDSGSLWVNTGDVNVGENGWYNELRILSGAVVSNANGSVGHANFGVLGNSALVSGGTWINNNAFNMVGGGGSLTVSEAGRLQSLAATLGNAGAGSSYSSNLTVTISGSGSVWSNLSTLYVGNYSSFNNQVLVTNGGRLVSLGAINVGNGTSNLNNRLVISDANSLVDNGANILLVGAGTVGDGNQVIVTNGATLRAGGINVGVGVFNSNNLLLVSGPGSLVQLLGGLSVGTNGTTGGTIPRGVGSALITDGATLEARSLAGGVNSGTISNLGGVFQFATNTPVVTPNTAGSIVLKDGVVSFRGMTNAAVNGQITNIAYSGANTLRLDASTNAALAYVVSNGLAFSAIELVNDGSTWRGPSLLVGEGGLLRASNANATLAAVLTNAGTVSVVNGQLAYLSNVVLNGGLFLTQNGTNNFTRGLAMAAGATLTFTNGSSYVGGAITSSGAINAVNANVTFGGAVVISGLYSSDPSTNTFTTNATVTASGALSGSNGDLFVFMKDLSMQSTNASQFNLANAAVLFSNGPSHLLSISNSGALDIGNGFTDFAQVATNFAIAQLSIALGDRLTLAGNRDSLTNALYVGWLDVQGWSTNGPDPYLSVSNSLVGALNLPNVNLYYDRFDARNTWLNDWIPGSGYELWGAGNGLLLPIPEPSSLLVLAGGLALLAFRRRRA